MVRTDMWKRRLHSELCHGFLQWTRLLRMSRRLVRRTVRHARLLIAVPQRHMHGSASLHLRFGLDRGAVRRSDLRSTLRERRLCSTLHLFV